MNEQNEERMLDLLCKQAVEGLTQTEENELRELETMGFTGVDLQSLEYTAAAISTLGVSGDDKLPDHLKSKILAAADEHFVGKRIAPQAPAIITETKTPIWAWLGWAAAAAASLLLVANLWVSNSRGPGPLVGGPPTTPTPAPEKLTPNQLREKFLASVPPTEMVKAEWGAGGIKEIEPSGDVVWSDATQTGYLRVKGLPKNDPNNNTYQLWIVAENQDSKTPVDGGTFDINSDGEVIIPIDAKVRTLNPKAFAITIEKPGGVVVSTQKHAALAAVKPNQA